MRLLVVSTWFPYPADNGSRVRALSLLRELSRRHSISLLSFSRSPGQAEPGPLAEWCDRVEVVQAPVVDRRRLGFRGLMSPIPRYYAQTHSTAMAGRVAHLVATHEAALGLQIEAARYLAPHRSVPRVFEEAEVSVLREARVTEQRRLRRLRRELTWRKHRRYVRQLVARFERTTVVSELERAQLVSLGCDPARVVVVPNGIDVPEAPPRPAHARASRLIYPGSVQYFANLDAVRFFVREILPLVRRARPGTSFWVTGSLDGVDVSDLVRDGAHFTGAVPDIDTLVAESAACVVPLRIGGGTRLKVLQAMALGTPVVSTRKGAEGLDVEAGEHFLSADDAAGFARAVLALLADPALGERLARSARTRVEEEYTWRNVAAALEGALADAVAVAEGERPILR